jgi:hypothetical protein
MSERSNRIGSTSVVFPLLLIGFGALMMVWRTVPNFYPWHAIGKYWPLILILIGAGMVLDRMRYHASSAESRPFPIGSTIGTILFLVVMALLIRHDHFNHLRFSSHASASAHEAKTVDRGDAKAVRFNIEMAAGELIFQGGGDHLLTADFFQDGSWPTPKVDYSVSDSVGYLKITQEGHDQFVGVGKSDNTWNLRVNDATPLELKVDVGAGRGEFHLDKVDLTRLELNIGAGQANVDLTGERAKDLQVTIQGGVGQAAVRLPRNIGVVATVHGGLGSIDTHGLTEENGKYVNAAYGKSPNTIHLTIEGGIGQIKLDQE